MPRYGMVVDLDRCMGCRACMEACKVENATGEDVFWMYVFRFEEGEYPNTAVKYLPRPCMHCDNPPCVKVCPVGARFKQEDGLVLTDADRCIGCRYCEVACPYGVNYFAIQHPKDSYYANWDEADLDGDAARLNPPYRSPDLDEPHGAEGRLVAGGGHEKGVMEKCTFCVHRLEKGLDPACVTNCPTSVFTFGDLDDPDSAVSKKLKRSHFRLLEESGTRARVYYTGGAPPADDARQFEPVRGRA